MGDVKERPILFSGPLVRAILDGRKTQTRRLVRPQPPPQTVAWNFIAASTDGDRRHKFEPRDIVDDIEARCGEPIRSPYGLPGDRLWVRETWQYNGTCHTSPEGVRGFTSITAAVTYRADGTRRSGIDVSGTYPAAHPKQPTWLTPEELSVWWARWRPSIHMPRWASRIDLEVTKVGVERLQDITAEDVMAEGVQVPAAPDGSPLLRITGKHAPTDYLDSLAEPPSANELLRAEFASLWDGINAKIASWASNPWVWVVGFKVVEVRR